MMKTLIILDLQTSEEHLSSRYHLLPFLRPKLVNMKEPCFGLKDGTPHPFRGVGWCTPTKVSECRLFSGP